ncbi:MAG: hypothetical protein AB8B91_25780 [Rubripirellula sp.]
MSNFHDARALRLERLESRSLLAAGVFDFGLSTGNSDADRPHRQPPGDSARPHEVARDPRQSARPERTGHEPRHQDRSSRPRQGSRNALKPTRFEAPPAQQETPSPAVSVPTTLTGSTDRPEDQTARPVTSFISPSEQTFVSVQPTTLASPSRLVTPQPQASSRQPSATDAAIASLVSEASTEAAVDSVPVQTADEVSTIDSTASSPIAATDGPSVTQENAASRIADHANVDYQPSADNKGFIELSPLESFQPSTQDTSESEPWELDRYTIPWLQRIAQHTIEEHGLGDRADVADQMMRDWFSGPGGLIALDQVKLPAFVLPLDPTMIDVGLESTVALHRSLNIVGSNVTPALSGPVLDAIMTSLERVVASETQPTIEPSTLRVPVAVYPVVAALATTMAVSARRKHKRPASDLEFAKSST